MGKLLLIPIIVVLALLLMRERRPSPADIEAANAIHYPFAPPETPRPSPAKVAVAPHPTSKKQGKKTVAVPSDPKARYFALSRIKRPDGLVEITTARKGPLGQSYSTRLVDCAASQWDYMADGDSWEEFQRSRHEPDHLTPLSYGSISYYVAQYACSQPAAR
jgi:hypothetical protein